jgi:2-keto-4-pentenoate hydratase
MEINEIRVTDAGDFPLLVADNLAQWGIVVGETCSPVPADFDSDTVRARIDCEGETRSEDLGADVIDDHFLSLAALANELAPFGRRVEVGQRVITGSFSNHRVPSASHWRAQFSGVGSVAISFA